MRLHQLAFGEPVSLPSRCFCLLTLLSHSTISLKVSICKIGPGKQVGRPPVLSLEEGALQYKVRCICFLPEEWLCISNKAFLPRTSSAGVAAFPQWQCLTLPLVLFYLLDRIIEVLCYEKKCRWQLWNPLLKSSKTSVAGLPPWWGVLCGTTAVAALLL